MNKNLLLVIILIIFSNHFTFSQSLQSFKMPEGLSLSNQLEYSYNTDDKREIFENWFNLDYRRWIFSAGLRFDVFQPNDPDPSISRGKDRFAEIDFIYFKTEIGSRREGFKLTVGNYYELFSRGLVLKSYENRSIRIDNNLIGVNLSASYANFYLKALTGMAANANNERTDILHAADLEFKGIKNIKLGATFASNKPNVENAARTDLASVRLVPKIWNFDIYAEYGIKQNADVNKEVFNDEESKIGEAIYGNINFYYDKFSISGEYKYYDNYSFTSHDRTIEYNTPPSLRMDQTYILLNRHPSQLDPNNEEGYQFEANYTFNENSILLANYNETNTLESSSYYQRIIGTSNPSRTQLKDFYIQFTQTWSRSLETIFAFNYNEELSSSTKNITPILENKFYFGDIHTFRVVLEHQQTEVVATTEKYFDDVITLEYLRSPNISISLVAEMKTSEPENENLKRDFWGFVRFGYNIAHHTNVSLLIGSRQAGNICIGGVCRYEPEFEGIELKILTRLY